MTCGCNNLGLKEQLAEVASVNAALTAKLADIREMANFAMSAHGSRVMSREEVVTVILAIIDGTQE
jgi:hypothetical protein